MARREGYNGRLIIDHLKDLKKGDTVYCSYWGGKYVPVTVTRVRTVECATIVTIAKTKNLAAKRFVGYHTDKVAMSERDYVLTIETYLGDKLQESLKRAEERTATIIARADALKAMMTLKDWLFRKEDEILDREAE